MPFDDDYILCYGTDELLLSTRRALLSTLGPAVICTSDQSTVKDHLSSGKVSILVICHSVAMDEMEEILKFHEEIGSSAKILCLTTSVKPHSLQCRTKYDISDGPAAFVAAVRGLGTFPVLH